MKLIKFVVGIAVVAVLGYFLYTTVFSDYLNKLTVDTVEEQGTKMLSTKVSLAAADMAPHEGRGELKNLQINNPAGFNSEYALHTDAVVLQIDPASLLDDVKVVKEVTIDGAKLIAEQKNLKETNLQALLDSVNKNSSGGSAQESAQGPEVRLMVEKFRFTNGSVRLISEQFGERSIKLPAIKVNNIGDKSKGLTPQELGQAMIAPVLQQVKAAVTAEVTEIAKDKAEQELKKKLTEKLGEDKVKDLKKLFGR